ncbi:autotransporter outer membrane beta-barrel domain-containing protein [Roseomonas sp. KE2513]|nr:autotransporter outer membrane beta-barrel domain-containing protein [Roseomonas sp. KE2513]
MTASSFARRLAQPSFPAAPHVSNRARLLSSCSAAAALALLVGAQPAGAQTQTTCGDISYGGCSLSSTAPNGATPRTPDFDKSGNNGNPGTPGTSINIDLSQVPGTGGLYYAAGSTPAVALTTQAGSGSDGTDASNNAVGPVPNLSAGSGGAAGAAGTITVTMPQGSNTQIISGIDQYGDAAADAPALQVYSSGGNGGGGGVPTQGGLAGVSQPGANGGNITINAYANPNQAESNSGQVGAIQSIQTGILAQSIAGNGGSGHPHVTDYAKQGVDGATTDANNGALPGSGGTINVNLGTSIVAYTQFFANIPPTIGPSSATPGAGIWAVSAGGNGGNGGTGSDKTDGGSGGNGGAAGAGGAINVTVTNQGSVNVQLGSYFTTAIWAQSFGGIGGLGANESGWASGGNSGAGGNGGAITVVNNGSLTTASADHAPGILAQSFGGAGQSGGTGGGWGAQGGEGASGGDGGTISISGSGSINTSSTNSPGILAQSIGGGGGSGGNDRGWLAVGGAGAIGGSGGTVVLSYGGTVRTVAELSSGMAAQSIGGGGGSGGDARGSGAFLNLSVGGQGAGGGNGGSIQATNTGTVSTGGAHSPGLLLQSIGGGGGSGGAAYSRSLGVAGSASVALGGTGGGGGDGGAIGFAPGASTTNSGAVITAGHDSFGIVAQSIGAGGGLGGAAASKATAYSVPGNDDIPTVAISVSLAGSGGTGGSGGAVTLDNGGLLATRGAGAAALVAQSIGGGGGAGGDASAHASAQGSSSFNLTGVVSFGGRGGGGGSGGAVAASNNGLIITSGESADGLLAQSIGGGGGAGGTGDGQGKATGDDASNVSVTLNMGGQGAGGGGAGLVAASNNGAILTLGDGAVGIMAQAVGGGGGRGGGAAGTSSGTYAATVNIGANGGAGGSTFTGQNSDSVSVTTGAGSAVVTFGASAPGIVAQSIAGGGGQGGKAASTIGHATSSTDGGTGTAATLDSAYARIAAAIASGGASSLNEYNSVQALTALATSLVTGAPVSVRRLGDAASDGDALENLGGETGENEDSSDATSITANVGVGGRGGSGGSAGNVTVTNSGRIGTVGPMSDGILAQSIGGGGGNGGAAISSTTSGDVQGAIGVGGNGGGGGNGASVTVANNGVITTIGSQSIGIVAQSIAGGGGIAGTSAAKVKPDQDSDSSVLSVPISVGGNGGGAGVPGTVTVTNNGGIETRSHDAIGILAQSIQGGGGMVRTRSSNNEDNNGGRAVANGGSYGINLAFGGKDGNAREGSSGDVNVNHYGNIVTLGRNAYGILAQSVGGGGGLVLGGTPNNATNPFAGGTMFGSAGNVTVTIGNATGEAGSAGSITTSGQGAVAVLAQSVGGGGGLAGDTGLTAQRSAFTQSASHVGNGGSIGVFVNPTATLTTNAANTPVILAQSVGGGGGRVTGSAFGASNGTAGGDGAGGAVTVDVGGQVLANGAASPGIYAESVGQATSANPNGGSAIRINVLPGGTVRGGTNFSDNDGYGAAIYIVGGSSVQTSPGANNINNEGTITSLGGTTASGTAIYSTGGWSNIYNQPNGGVINGSINLQNGGGGGNLFNYGTVNAGPIMHFGAGTATNAGTLTVGGNGSIGNVAVTGNLVQTGAGRLVLDTNHVTGAADRVAVQGQVRLGGTLEVRPAAVANRAVTVLTATDGIALDPSLTSTRTHLFAFDARQAGNSLLVQPRAEFTGQAAGLGANQRAVAAHLQELWNGGANVGSGFTALAGVRDGAGYGQALNSLSGQTVGAISASRFASSRDFSTNMLNDCATFEGAGVSQDEANCGWARAFGSTATQDSTGGTLGYKATSWTMQTGGQVQIAPGWFVGGSIAYQSSVFRGDAGSSKVSGDSALIGGLLRYQAGPWQVSGAIDAGYGWYESQRSVTAGSFQGTARAKPDAWHVGAHARLAYQVPFGDEAVGWYVQPRVDLHLNYVRSGGYTESGAAPFNLTVTSQGATTFTAVPAVEVGGRVRLSEATVLRPFASAGVELGANGDWAATARLASQPASRGFRASTPIPDVLGKFTLGAELLTTANWDLRVQYSAAVGDRYTSHAGLARVAYRF